jgi:tetratricopeptide (TPR) repeat protein
MTWLFQGLVFAQMGGMESSGKEKPAELLPGFGTQTHRVSTRNRMAQKFFDQGLRMVYAFNHDEAVRSFKRAAELDPKLAMAYWGIGYALGPNINKEIDREGEKAAYEATQTALKLSANASVIERGYIDALAKRYSIDPNADLKKLAVDFRNAMGEVSQHYPNDLDAATLYAESMMVLHPWQLWSNDGTPTEGTEEIVRVLESVLKRNPNHVGAIHYYIHTVEASPHPELALPYVAKLPAQMPAAGHLVHMPSHTYIRTGDYLAAARSNSSAMTADEAYMKRTGANDFETLMLHNHNVHFLAVANGILGNYREAMKAAHQLEENLSPLAKQMPMVEGFLIIPSQLMVQFQKWDEILRLPEPDATRVQYAMNWHFVRAFAYAHKGEVAPAEAEYRKFSELKSQLPARASSGLNKASDVWAVADQILAAQIAMAKKEDQAADDAFHRAIAAEDALNYDEPRDWILPVREMYGHFLIRRNDYPGAERAFRDDLKISPKGGRSLFGLYFCLIKQGKSREIPRVWRAFNRAWKNADTDLEAGSF